MPDSIPYPQNKISVININGVSYAISDQTVQTILEIIPQNNNAISQRINDLNGRLSGIEATSYENVQSDWDESDSTQDTYILNKPDLSHFLTIETNPNWNETNSSSAAYIQNKPSSIVTSVNGDTGAVTIQENVQADWNSTTGASQILNKPNIVIENGGNNNSSIIFSPANLNINAGSGYDLNLSGNSVDINGLIFYNGDVVDANGESVLLKVLNAWSPEYDTTSDIDDITLSNDVYKVNFYELEIDSISNEIIGEHLSKGLLIHNDNTQYLIKDNEIKYRVYENNTWSEWQNGTPVTSVNGMTGAVTITHPVTSVNGQQGDVTLSIPTVPTTSTTVTENDTNPVSGGAVYAKFADLIGTAPAALDTLQEIATALNNDADLASTLTNQITSKIPKVSNPTTHNFAYFNSDGTIADSTYNYNTFLTSETQLSKGTTTGAGNAVTDITVNDHEITLTKGATFLTYHQSLKTVNNESLVGTGNIVISGLPQVSASDNGKILMVVNGQWQLVSPSVLYSGQGVPNNANGNNGDLYMQTE